MGWLDNLEDGGKFGGLTNKGFKYNGAWGGQFQEGGRVTDAEEEGLDIMQRLASTRRIPFGIGSTIGIADSYAHGEEPSLSDVLGLHPHPVMQAGSYTALMAEKERENMQKFAQAKNKGKAKGPAPKESPNKVVDKTFVKTDKVVQKQPLQFFKNADKFLMPQKELPTQAIDATRVARRQGGGPVGSKNRWTDEQRRDFAKKSVEEARRRIEAGEWTELPEDVVKAGEAQGLADCKSRTCIAGVSDIYKQVGAIDRRYYGNTEFEKQAEKEGFVNKGWGLKGISNLEPGDMMQYRTSQAMGEAAVPTHAQMFMGINPETGQYEFFDNYHKKVMTYPKEDVEAALNPEFDKNEGNAVIYKINPYNPAGKEDMKALAQRNEMIKQEVGKEGLPYTFAQKAGSPDTTPRAMKGINEFINQANDKATYDKVIKATGADQEEVADAMLNVYGQLKQETYFGDPKGDKSRLENFVEKGLSFLDQGKGLSVGPGQIKMKQLTPEQKEAYGIKKQSDLYDMKKVIPLMADINIKNKKTLEQWDKEGKLTKRFYGTDVNEDHSQDFKVPGLTEEQQASELGGLMRFAPYLYNQYGDIRRGKRNVDDEKISNITPEGGLYEQHRMDPGSYPAKVAEAWQQGLIRTMNKSPEENTELSNITIEIPAKANGGWLDNFQDGGRLDYENELMSRVITERNKDKNFVQRATNPEDYPHIVTPEGKRATHQMGYGTDDEGNAYAYPNIVQNKMGLLDWLNPREASRYAQSTGEEIKMSDPQLAEYYTRQGLIKHQSGGSIPGSVGFTYAREGAPSNGPHAKKTLASAQVGGTVGADAKNLALINKLIERKRTGNYSEVPRPSFKDPREDMVKKADRTAVKKPVWKGMEKMAVKNKTEAELAEQARIEGDQIEIQRRATRERADASPLNTFSGMLDKSNWSREELEAAGAGLESKFRTSDRPNWFDDYVNPFNQIGGMAADLGAAPNQIVQQDSMAPLIGAVAAPLLTGAFEGVGTGGSNRKFANNLLNPLNIVPGYASAERKLMSAAESNPYYRLGRRKINKFGEEVRESIDKDIVRPFEDEIVYPLKYRKQIADVKKMNQESQELLKTPEGRARLEKVMGIDPDNLDFPRLTTSPRQNSWYSPMENRINLDMRQIDKLQKIGYELNPKTVFAHEKGHWMQREAHRHSPEYKQEWKQYWEDMDAYNKPITRESLNNPDASEPIIKFLNENRREPIKPEIAWSKPTNIDKFASKLYGYDPKSNIIEVPGLDELPGTLGNTKRIRKSAKYFTDEQNEQLAHLREMRQNMMNKGFIKNEYDTITEDMIQEFMEKNPADRVSSFTTPTDEKIEGLAKLFRNLPAVGTALGAGAAATQMGEEEEAPEFKGGGIVKDNRGYWNPKNWGKPVQIDSNDITMRGVRQPLWGISNTGDTKYMQPGQDYKFEGTTVTEIPAAKNGKELTKLDQLTNFTNYNTKQPGGWLDNL